MAQAFPPPSRLQRSSFQISRMWSAKGMQTLVQEIRTQHTPDTLAHAVRAEPGLVLLRSRGSGQYSFVAARPFLQMRASGSECRLNGKSESKVVFGNPWHILESLVAR